MLTEFDVRREVSAIERAAMHPLRKVRRLVRIARQARREARMLRQGAEILSQDCMDEEAGRLRRAIQKLIDLNREVMDRARRILSGDNASSAGSDPSGPSSSQPTA
ncbi:MAG: hypothetical protein KIT74_03435 [Fimbriimonadales bacterium]|nr:hypothetical protein [Fimbriimonadales bacterium]